MLAFIAIAYLFVFPATLLAILLLKGRQQQIAGNLLAVVNLSMLVYSLYEVRQLIGLLQFALELGISPLEATAPGGYMYLLMLLIILPFLFLKRSWSANKIIGCLIWLLLVALHTSLSMGDNPFQLLFSILFYLCLLCTAYALLWLLKRLPGPSASEYVFAPNIFIKYLKHQLNAANRKGHGVHSPFVYAFIRNVLNDKRKFYAFEQIEKCRKDLLANNNVLTVEDFGAGSGTKKSKQRSILEIAGSSLKPKKISQLLFRIANYFSASRILELGTSFGITTAYMASANAAATVWTLEEASAVADVASSNFEKLGLKNINLTKGDFDETLGPVLDAIDKLDLVFIDGNHRYEPTIRYFEQLLPKLHEGSILIFDDIHCSKEMEDAWDQIRENASVTLTIDLFFIGLVFFRKESIVKQDFILST